MKITSIDIAPLKIGLKKPFVTALRRVDEIDDIVIKIYTDSGLSGYGAACAVTAITGTTNEAVLNDLKKTIFPSLIGQEIDNNSIFAALQSLKVSPEAKACVDIALYDLLAKENSQSLFQYLGAHSNELQTDLTVSVNEAEDMAADAIDAITQGFSVLKIKLDSDVQKNIYRLNKINSALSPHIKLRLDPNQALDFQSCLNILQSVRTDNVECIEQPFPRTDIQLMKSLKEKSIVPVLADESLFDFNDAKRLLEDGAVDMLNIKLMKCGGIHEAIRIAQFAKSQNIECMIGSMLEGPISLLAATHFALSQDNITMADLDSPFYLNPHPLLEPFHLYNDRICLDDTSGLGVDKIIQDLKLF